MPREKRFFLAERVVRQKEPLFFTQGNWLCIKGLHSDGRKNSCKIGRKIEYFCQNRRVKTGKRTCELLKLHECNLQITAETWKHLLPSRETVLVWSEFFDALENSLQHFESFFFRRKTTFCNTFSRLVPPHQTPIGHGETNCFFTILMSKPWQKRK